MATQTQEILHNFDQLPSTDQIEIAIQILKRLADLDFPPLTDDDLVFHAEELFLALDQQELHIQLRAMMLSLDSSNATQ